MHLYNISRRLSVNRVLMSRILLLFIWIAGLLLGLFLSVTAYSQNASLMRIASQSSVSIVGLTVAIFFPFVFIAIAFITNLDLLVLPALFIKSTCFAFCGCGMFLCYGSAGWLVRWLFMFSDTCAVLLVLWFTLKQLAENKKSFRRDFTVCCLLLMFFGILEILMIIPFTVALF